MQGNETRALLVSIFGAIVGYIVSLALRLPTAILIGLNPGRGMVILDGVIAGIAQVVSVPFVSIPFTLLYYDGRIRKEAFDLEMMARNLGAAGRPAAGAPSPASPRGRPAPASAADASNAEPPP